MQTIFVTTRRLLRCAGLLAALFLFVACAASSVTYKPGAVKQAVVPFTMEMPPHMTYLGPSEMWAGIAFGGGAIGGAVAQGMSQKEDTECGAHLQREFLAAFRANVQRSGHISAVSSGGDAVFTFKVIQYGYIATGMGLGGAFGGRVKPFVAIQASLQRMGGEVLWRQTFNNGIGGGLPGSNSREIRDKPEQMKAGLTLAARAAADKLAASLCPAASKH